MTWFTRFSQMTNEIWFILSLCFWSFLYPKKEVYIPFYILYILARAQQLASMTPSLFACFNSHADLFCLCMIHCNQLITTEMNMNEYTFPRDVGFREDCCSNSCKNSSFTIYKWILAIYKWRITHNMDHQRYFATTNLL